MEVQGLSDKTSQPAAGSPPPAGNPSPPAPGAGAASDDGSPQRPAWLPESHWNPDAGSINDETFGAHYQELATFHQAETERLASLPTKPEDVKVGVPDDLEIPEGVELQVNTDSPQFKAFQEFVVANKIGGEQAQGLYTLFLQEQIGQASAVNARVAEEAKKLGPNKEARIDALGAFLTAQIGDKAAALVGKGRLWTADQVEALEALQAKFTSQGAPAIPAKKGEPPPPPAPMGIAETMWPGMSRKAG